MDSRRPRPFGVTVIVVLFLLAATADLASGLTSVAGVENAVATRTLPALNQLEPLVLPLVLGLLRLAAAVGLLRQQRWAWVLVMLLTGSELAGDLWVYVAGGDRPYWSMLLNVATVFYLNQSEVQRAFGQRPDGPRMLDAPVREAP